MAPITLSTFLPSSSICLFVCYFAVVVLNLSAAAVFVDWGWEQSLVHVPHSLPKWQNSQLWCFGQDVTLHPGSETQAPSLAVARILGLQHVPLLSPVPLLSTYLLCHHSTSSSFSTRSSLPGGFRHPPAVVIPTAINQCGGKKVLSQNAKKSLSLCSIKPTWEFQRPEYDACLHVSLGVEIGQPIYPKAGKPWTQR